jgi:outer membrane protein X
MKKLVLISTVILLFSAPIQAQYSYKPFRVDLGFGISVPTGSNSTGWGVLLRAEPKYSFHEQMSGGLRQEFNMLLQSKLDSNSEFESINVIVNGSTLATFDYHFNTASFRPFVGAGLGIYTSGSATVSKETTDEPVKLKRKAGGMIRAGFDVAHFRLSLEYNIAGKTQDINLNYFAVVFAGYIGGGKRN